MFREALRAEIRQAVVRAMEAGAIPHGEIPAIDVDIPRDRRHGDYASNAALVLAKQAGAKPRDVAARLIECVAPAPERIERLEIAGPGFINITLAWPWRRELVATVRRLGDDYGLQSVGRAKPVVPDSTIAPRVQNKDRVVT